MQARHTQWSERPFPQGYLIGPRKLSEIPKKRTPQGVLRPEGTSEGERREHRLLRAAQRVWAGRGGFSARFLRGTAGATPRSLRAVNVMIRNRVFFRRARRSSAVYGTYDEALQPVCSLAALKPIHISQITIDSCLCHPYYPTQVNHFAMSMSKMPFALIR